MKALKRTMAGEYSRELGVKVLAGQQRLARLGFKQGGMPGYGLRRMLVSSDGQRKQVLASGERKSIATDRVILARSRTGSEGRRRHLPNAHFREPTDLRYRPRTQPQGGAVPGGARWTHSTVADVLTQPKYAGFHVYGRTTSRIYTPTVRLPKSDWLLCQHAFDPVVDYSTFLEAQKILESRTINRSDDELLESLRALLAREGRLSLRLVNDSPDVPSPSTYGHRFGSLQKAYKLIGYGRTDQFGSIDLRHRTQGLREDLVAEIAAMFHDSVSVVRRGGRWRSRLRLRNRLMVSVLVARYIKVWGGTVRWQIDPVWHERRCLTLLARLDEGNRSFLDFHVLPNIDRPRRFYIRRVDTWLERGIPLGDLSLFCTVVAEARAKKIQETRM
jgi:hypothetical protein